MREAINVAKNATALELKKFGFIFATFLFSIFYVLLPWLKDSAHPSVVLYVALCIAFVSFLSPRLLRPLFYLASIIGSVLGAINNRLILSLIFFLIFSPLAILMRVFSKNDSMRAKIDKDLKTYRVLCADKNLIKNKEKAF